MNKHVFCAAAGSVVIQESQLASGGISLLSWRHLVPNVVFIHLVRSFAHVDFRITIASQMPGRRQSP